MLRIVAVWKRLVCVEQCVMCAVAWPRCEWCCDCFVYCSTTPPCSNFTPSCA